MNEELAPHVEDIARALNDKLNHDQIEEELSRYIEYGVPLQQAKRDIVRNHGGSTRVGAKKLADLMGEERGVDLLVKVQTVNEKQIETREGPRTLWYGYIADDTKSLQYTAWKDPEFEKGRVYEIRNAYVKTFRDQPDVNLGDYTELRPSDEDIDAVDGFPASGGGATTTTQTFRPGEQVAVRDLQDGLGNVTVVGRITEAEDLDITVRGEPKTIRKGVLADETGRIGFTSWEPVEALQAGAGVKIEGAYVKTWRGAPELNLGDKAIVSPVEDAPAPEEVAAVTRLTIGELDERGGGMGVEVEGVLIDVKPGSGLIFRCPECNRVLQRRECRLHGRVEGTPDMRIKGVLDDGYGAVLTFVGREATEALLGMGLDEAREKAKDAMSTEIIEEDLREKLVGHRFRARGNATSDEYGLQLIASEMTDAPAPDTEREAERLLGELRDMEVMV